MWISVFLCEQTVAPVNPVELFLATLRRARGGRR
jgi:hypothetical protein